MFRPTTQILTTLDLIAMLSDFIATIECSDQGNGAQVVQERISICERSLPAFDLGSLHWIPLQQDALLLTMASSHRHRSQAYECRRLRTCSALLCIVIVQASHYFLTYKRLTYHFTSDQTIARYPTKSQEHTQENLKLLNRIRSKQHPRSPLRIPRLPQGSSPHVNLLLQVPRMVVPIRLLP